MDGFPSQQKKLTHAIINILIYNNDNLGKIKDSLVSGILLPTWRKVIKNEENLII